MQEFDKKMQEFFINGKITSDAGKRVKNAGKHLKCRNCTKNAGNFYFPTLFLPKAKKISWELGIMLKFNVNNNFQKVENYLNFHIK